ncbi:alpha/beta-hydrolase [Hypoxylon sp. FL1284]|nr:alpha/beta-hydrolase [Hypoxylon sp. FL1284]
MMRRTLSLQTIRTGRRTNESTVPITDRSTTTGSWTTESQPDSANSEGLFFVSLNPLAPVTVVLIHLGIASHLEWSHTWPKLSEYHLLIPDLPQHSRSRHIKPFSFGLAAEHIANIIREHAQDKRAHLVGISTGGFVAMEVIKRYPDVVASAFLSGAVPLKDSLWTSQPRLAFLGLTVMLHSPRSVLFKATRWAAEFQNEELLREIKRNNTSRLYEAVTRETAAWRRDDMVEVGRQDKRIALVAGGRQDNVEGAREMAHLLESLGTADGRQTRAFVVRDAIHGWHLQLPLLFAKGIRAWIENTPMPEGFELLEMEMCEEGPSE